MRGLYGYLNKNMRGRKGQSGFTLIELLVVVTILGVLAAIVTLSLVGLTTKAEAQACNQEYKTVQAGLDAYMAYNDVSSLTTGSYGTSTNVMGGTGAELQLYNALGTPTFVRNSPTVYLYTWDQFGRITGMATTTGVPLPSGCQVSGSTAP
ncbi:MAG: type II secretion system protein [Candidatus Dormibacteraceae bacterium]